MADWFDFNGTRSTSLGVVVTKHPNIPLAKERVTNEPIPGRSGSLTTLEGAAVYDDVVVSIPVALETFANLDAVAAWLRGAGDLVLGDNPGRYYKARCSNQMDLAKVFRSLDTREFNAVFRCAPYRYAYPAYTAYQIAATVKTIASQAGSGTPSPDNIRAISGKTTVKVTVDGVDNTLTPDATLYGVTGYESEIRTAGAITRKTALVTLVGSESWTWGTSQPSTATLARFSLTKSDMAVVAAGICSHFPWDVTVGKEAEYATAHPSTAQLNIFINKARMAGWSDAWTNAQKQDAFKAWLAAQNTATTPVRAVYRLATAGTATVAAKMIYHVNNTDAVTTDGSSITSTYTGVTSTVYTASPASIENPGTADATPFITIVGSGDIDLTIGTRTIHVDTLASSITIDTDTGYALNGSTDLTSTVTFDAYPWTIPPGTVAISWTGTVTSLTITCPWRYI